MDGACRPTGNVINAYKILIEYPKSKQPLGRPRPRWEEYINVGSKEALMCGLFYVAQHWKQWRHFVYTVVKLHIP
jgi:hypothetical protein